MSAASDARADTHVHRQSGPPEAEGSLNGGCRDLGPYLGLSEVHQGLPGAALLGMEQPAELGALHHPVEQEAGVGARAGAGSQAPATERLDRPCQRGKGPVSLGPGARARLLQACLCWADPPGQTVRVRLPSSERSGCFWAVTRKKCPGEVWAPSERLKWKPPSRAPEDRGGVGPHWPVRHAILRASPSQHPPLCENSTSPLSSWACVKLCTSVSGAVRSTTLPLSGRSMV